MKTLLALSVGLVLVSSQADAHHSFAASFVNTEIVQEGVVNRLIFRNPHVIIYMTVTDANGTETEWMVEGSAATSLRRAGWTNRSVQPGEHVADHWPSRPRQQADDLYGQCRSARSRDACRAPQSRGSCRSSRTKRRRDPRETAAARRRQAGPEWRLGTRPRRAEFPQPS